MLPASGGEKPSARAATRGSRRRRRSTRSPREREHAVELLAVAVDVDVRRRARRRARRRGRCGAASPADDVRRRDRARGARVRIASASPVSADRSRPWCSAVTARAPTGSSGRRATAPSRVHPAPALRDAQRPDRQLLQADDVRTVARHELDHLAEERPPPRRRGRCRGRGSKSGRAWPRRSVRGRARPARRSAGLHAAVRPRARRGARARGRGRRARHLPLPLRRRAGAGRIPRRELFYPLSSRVFGRSRLRLPLKVAEHPLGLASLRRLHADVLHVQWLPAPELDARLFRPHLPSVFTAHDLLPRRTAHRTDLWRRLFARFDRIVVHSENGRETLAELGVDADGCGSSLIRSSRASPARRDDGRTVLAFGSSGRTRGSATRSRRCGGPATRGCSSRATRSSRSSRTAPPRTGSTWSGGSAICPEPRSTARSAMRRSPSSRTGRSSTRAERSCARSAPASPRSPTTSAASPSRCAASARAASSRPATSTALAAALARAARRPAALEQARAGARRAREELTWDAAAQAHLALYEEIA